MPDRPSSDLSLRAGSSALFPGTEQLILCDDPRTGLRAVIAIDDTTLGPALGGVRFRSYPSEAAAVTEARRLAASMTLKNAAAGLPYGGGKSVIIGGSPVADRAALMRSFGRFVARLGGAYVPGVDMGTSVADLAEIGRAGADVACDTEDPSEWTALGVLAGIRGAVREVLGRPSLRGVTVAIQGVGHVGADLARRIAAEGGALVLADVDQLRVDALARELGATVVGPDEIVTVACDVLAPCAAARVVTAENVGRLRCTIVAGAANDVLSEPSLQDDLSARGITYVPDFLINAGGVIHIHALRAGWDRRTLEAAVLAIGDRVASVVDGTSAGRESPVDRAVRMTRRRIAARDVPTSLDAAA